MSIHSNLNPSKPFEPSRDFTKVHNAIYRLYTRLPGFKADHALAYMYLMSQHNENYGYAFPDTWDIALALNCGESKVSGIRRTLAEVDLIDTARHPVFGNTLYFVKAPITDEGEFYRRFPEAQDNYDKRKAAFDARRKSGAERKRAYDQRSNNDTQGGEGSEEYREILDYFGMESS